MKDIKSVLILVIVLLVAAAGLWLFSNKPTAFAPTTTPSMSQSDSDLQDLNSVNPNSIDTQLNGVDSESSGF